MKQELWRRVRSFSLIVGTLGLTSGAIALPFTERAGKSSVRRVDWLLLSNHNRQDSPGLSPRRNVAILQKQTKEHNSLKFNFQFILSEQGVDRARPYQPKPTPRSRFTGESNLGLTQFNYKRRRNSFTAWNLGYGCLLTPSGIGGG